MVCGPRRSATCNGSRSSCPRAACTFTVSRMGFPACTRFAVTRCGRFVSYAAITRQTPTYLFPSAAGQSVPSVSTSSSSGSGKPLTCRSRPIPTCSALPVASTSPVLPTTPRPCCTTYATRTSRTQSDTPKWRPTASRIFGANWRRQARDRLPLDYLGIGRIALRNQRLNHLDRALDLLIGHRLNAAGMLHFQLFRDEHGADLQVALPPHPLEHLAPMLLPVLRQIEQKALVERSARSLR